MGWTHTVRGNTSKRKKMETETGVWKPEVGKSAWTVIRDPRKLVVATIKEVMVTAIERGLHCWVSIESDKPSSLWEEYLFPTPKAAFASIKVYDLDGKEVVVTRDWLKIDPRHLSLAAGNEDPADPSQRDETDGRHRDPNFKGAQYPVVADPREITTPTDKRNGDHC